MTGSLPPSIPPGVIGSVVAFENADSAFDTGASDSHSLNGVSEVLCLNKVELHLGVEGQDERKEEGDDKEHGDEYEAFFVMPRSELPLPP